MFTMNARFLIIDDSKITREMIRAALHKMQYKNVDEADNGKIGSQKIFKAFDEKAPYDLVFCDINMPEIDGLKLLEMLRDEAKTQDLPLIIVTTESGKQKVIQAVMSGVSGYMVKPFHFEDIRKKMQEIFDRLNMVRRTGA